MTDPPNEIRVGPARREHVAEVVAMIRELAEFENLLDELEVTEESLGDYIFGPNRVAEMLVGFVGDKLSGYAVYFTNFSTFRGHPGIYLEDLYVRPQVRGKGLGKRLLWEVARIAHDRGCHRFEWAVLDWNRNARDFYESLGAQPLTEWVPYRMDREALAKLVTDTRFLE